MESDGRVFERASLLVNMLMMMLEETDRGPIDIANLSVCQILAQSIRDEVRPEAATVG